MSDDIAREQAIIIYERALRHQQRGQFADAIVLYKRSLALYPTAEAATFLGWTYSMMNRYDEAIEWCRKAIEIDPTFGNPYNDLGAYLIELGRWEEAISWLKKATTASRYENPEFAYLNLGRVYQHLGRYRTALKYYDQALSLNRFYRSAAYAKYALLGQLN